MTSDPSRRPWLVVRRYLDGNYRMRPGDWLILLIGVALLVGSGALALQVF